MGDGRILLKPQRDDSFKKVLSNEPKKISAGSISLDKATLFKSNEPDYKDIAKIK
jgi:hypothetical protein